MVAFKVQFSTINGRMPYPIMLDEKGKALKTHGILMRFWVFPTTRALETLILISKNCVGMWKPPVAVIWSRLATVEL